MGKERSEVGMTLWMSKGFPVSRENPGPSKVRCRVGVSSLISRGYVTYKREP